MKILIWRNGKLGNTLVILPFLQTLKETYPDVPVDIVVDYLGEELLRHHPAINKLIVYDKRGKHRSIPATIKFILSLRKERYTHSIHMKRFFRNEFLSFMAGIPNRFGFKTEGKRDLLTKTVDYSEKVNIVKTIYSIGRLFNFNSTEPPPYKFYTSIEDNDNAEKIIKDLGLTNTKFTVLHCGGQTSNDNKVPYSLYATLITELHGRKMSPVLIDSPGDSESVQSVLALLADTSIVKICKVAPIRTNALILSKASLFIGNNSGQIHLAALYEIPSILLYGSNKGLAEYYSRKWLPWQKKIKTFIYSDNLTLSANTANILEINAY
ncbi:MAG: glycosyltransferase family 9 protein [Fibrobacteres bacterium]|nr:glycosyltransferase family 9 protein [Fibrobacterota bacterium]